jgi:hypothetical protein
LGSWSQISQISARKQAMVMTRLESRPPAFVPLRAYRRLPSPSRAPAALPLPAASVPRGNGYNRPRQLARALMALAGGRPCKWMG